MTFDAAFLTILPTVDNDGVPLDAEIRTVPAEILVRFGAYTAEPVSGEWRGPDGTIYPDESVRVTVYCSEADREEAHALVKSAGHTLRQLAMFFEFRHPISAETIEID